MNLAERKAFSLGYQAGLRAMLLSINFGGAGDYSKGMDPEQIGYALKSQRTINVILKATNLQE